jgi:two-component system sensor histidine kinase KdpD
MTFDRTRIDLRCAVADAFEMQRPLAEPQNLRLVNDVQKDCPPIWTDRELLSRILQNLVGNAIKFTPAGGEIQVKTHASPDPEEMVEIQVSDSGPGIPAEVRDRLFEKFVTGRQKGHGSGLGLLFCRLAVEAQGGTIRAHNRPEGGATFTFTLPKVRKDQLS